MAPILTGVLALAALSWASAAQAAPWPWPVASTSTTVEARVPPPPGFLRVPQAEGSFGAWLRGLPVKAGRPPVRLYDGRDKRNQDAHAFVLDVDVGRADLQQCADAVMRLRAEYQWASGQRDALCFRFTSGDRAPWTAWAAGQRPRVRGRRVTWSAAAAPRDGYRELRAYLDAVFTYAGTHSLARELRPVADGRRVEPGDVFIQGGFPGHAVIVLDVAQAADGRRVMLLAQSFMPAQEPHVLRGPRGDDPWYPATGAGALETPEWRFDWGDLRRFTAQGCP